MATQNKFIEGKGDPSPSWARICGFIIPIVGAEDKLKRAILSFFVFTGRDSKILIIPTASMLEDTWRKVYSKDG